MKVYLFCLLLMLTPGGVLGMEFDLMKKQGDVGNTLLVIGGIQGDEPGGFNAAALLATRYRIAKGTLWIVPNLNFASIIKRSRGIHGDMNRKFDFLSKSDPEYHLVEEIKTIITDPQVDLVLNLHDGSGFYRTSYVDRLHNPDRWGQSCIIDQSRLAGVPFGALAEIGQRVTQQANQGLIDPAHRFNLKNTRTRLEDPQMSQTLTFFAIENNKPAFGIEASKSFRTNVRVYYHLLFLEAYMKELGISFRRDFELSPQGVKQALNQDILVALNDHKIQLDISDIRAQLNYVPLKKGAKLEFDSDNPLVAVLPYRNKYRIHYGNNRMGFLRPQYFEYDDSLDSVRVTVDGLSREFEMGSIVSVEKSFLVDTPPGYRVNIIGFTRKGVRNEKGLRVRKKDIISRYSIDKGGKIFRVEVYRNDKFAGMLLIDFRAVQQKVKLLARTNLEDGHELKGFPAH